MLSKVIALLLPGCLAAVAQTKPETGLPKTMKICVAVCANLEWADGRYENFDLQRRPHTVYEVETFTPQSIVIKRTELAIDPAYGLTAVYRGAFTEDAGGAQGTVEFKWPGHRGYPHSANWKATWDASASPAITETARERQELVDDIFNKDSSDSVADKRWVCVTGGESGLVSEARGEGAAFTPDASDTCLATLTRTARDGNLPQLYGKLATDLGGSTDGSDRLPHAIGAAVLSGKSQVSIGNQKMTDVTQPLAFDAGFTSAYMDSAPDKGAMDQAKLKAIAEQCLNKQGDAGTCYSIGYVYGAQAFAKSAQARSAPPAVAQTKPEERGYEQPQASGAQEEQAQRLNAGILGFFAAVLGAGPSGGSGGGAVTGDPAARVRQLQGRADALSSRCAADLRNDTGVCDDARDAREELGEAYAALNREIEALRTQAGKLQKDCAAHVAGSCERLSRVKTRLESDIELRMSGAF